MLAVVSTKQPTCKKKSSGDLDKVTLIVVEVTFAPVNKCVYLIGRGQEVNELRGLKEKNLATEAEMQQVHGLLI